jgi:hypothetical protein
LVICDANRILGGNGASPLRLQIGNVMLSLLALSGGGLTILGGLGLTLSALALSRGRWALAVAGLVVVAVCALGGVASFYVIAFGCWEYGGRVGL